MHAAGGWTGRAGVLGWKRAAGLCLAALAGAGVWSQEGLAATAPVGRKPPVKESHFVITPRGASASGALAQLHRKGLRVALVREFHKSLLPVPAEMRRRPVDGRKLVEALTGRNKVAWFHRGTVAIIHRGVSNATVRWLRTDLKSADAAKRAKAATLAGVMDDVRMIPLLLSAAKDRDPGVSKNALTSLDELGWSVALLVEPDTALNLAAKVIAKGAMFARRGVARGGLWAGGEKALPLIEKALDDKDSIVRSFAAESLGKVGGEKALAVLGKALEHKCAYVRASAGEALAQLGDEKALPLLEKALTIRRASTRKSAAQALGNVGGKKARALLKKVLDGEDAAARSGALLALGRADGRKALALLGKAMKDKDADIRASAAEALGSVGGERALALLEKSLNDREPNVREATARALLEAGGKRASDALLARLRRETDGDVRAAIILAVHSFPDDPALSRALKKAIRESTKSPDRGRPKPKPERDPPEEF